MSESINQNGINIEPGFYTLVYPNGEHRTLQVKIPRQGFFKDQKIIGYLCGSDNTSDYRFFGVLAKGQIHFWNKFSASVPDEKIRRIRIAVIRIAEDQKEAGKAYALKSGNCYRCNRLLTVPESILSGIGPECAKRAAKAEAAIMMKEAA